jgi:xanthine dehydrogenase molybdopterin-binding subunit B
MVLSPGVRASAMSQALAYCTFGAAVSEVEVDMLTGEHRVIRCDILFDCGRSMNPAVDMGQVFYCPVSTFEGLALSYIWNL